MTPCVCHARMAGECLCGAWDTPDLESKSRAWAEEHQAKKWADERRLAELTSEQLLAELCDPNNTRERYEVTPYMDLRALIKGAAEALKTHPPVEVHRRLCIAVECAAKLLAIA